MIVVVGSPVYRAGEDGRPDAAAGQAAAIAVAAASEGADVELVGKIGDDSAGDALLVALAAANVGHAAILRDPVHATPLVARSGAMPLADDDEVALGASLSDEEATGLSTLLPAAVEDRPTLDAADVELALRFLPSARVLVVAEGLDDQTAAVVAEACRFAGAQLVAVVQPGDGAPAAFADATVLEAPPADDDGAFSRVVGSFAAGIAAGTPPARAFDAAIQADGWQPADS